MASDPTDYPPTQPSAPELPTPRARPLSEQPALALRAAELLRTPSTRLPLSDTEAADVVAQLVLVHYPAGAVVLKEGDALRSEFMLLVLEGEVQVDAGQDRSEPVPISVLGPGDILGEMSLIDGAPRSATCTAMSPLRAAALSRRALEALFDQHPRTAAKLMMGVAHRLAERLRALGQQLQMLAELSPPR